MIRLTIDYTDMIYKSSNYQHDTSNHQNIALSLDHILILLMPRKNQDSNHCNKDSHERHMSNSMYLRNFEQQNNIQSTQNDHKVVRHLKHHQYNLYNLDFEPK